MSTQQNTPLHSLIPAFSSRIKIGVGGCETFSGFRTPIVVQKAWGFERHYENNEYCMKWLHFRPNTYCSMHYHLDKHETMLVVDGTLTIEYIVDKEKHSVTLDRGDAFTVSRGLAHRLVAGPEGADLIEASTPDHPDDSIRIG